MARGLCEHLLNLQLTFGILQEDPASTLSYFLYSCTNDFAYYFTSKLSYNNPTSTHLNSQCCVLIDCFVLPSHMMWE